MISRTETDHSIILCSFPVSRCQVTLAQSLDRGGLLTLHDLVIPLWQGTSRMPWRYSSFRSNMTRVATSISAVFWGLANFPAPIGLQISTIWFDVRCFSYKTSYKPMFFFMYLFPVQNASFQESVTKITSQLNCQLRRPSRFSSLVAAWKPCQGNWPLLK